MAQPQPFSLARAVLGGLTLGALAAAAILAWSAWNSAHTECEFPGTEECNFQEANDQYIASLQGFAALGLVLMSAGLYLTRRGR